MTTDKHAATTQNATQPANVIDLGTFRKARTTSPYTIHPTAYDRDASDLKPIDIHVQNAAILTICMIAPVGMIAGLWALFQVLG